MTTHEGFMKTFIKVSGVVTLVYSGRWKFLSQPWPSEIEKSNTIKKRLCEKKCIDGRNCSDDLSNWPQSCHHLRFLGQMWIYRSQWLASPCPLWKDTVDGRRIRPEAVIILKRKHAIFFFLLEVSGFIKFVLPASLVPPSSGPRGQTLLPCTKELSSWTHRATQFLV